jgi:surface antigen
MRISAFVILVSLVVVSCAPPQYGPDGTRRDRNYGIKKEDIGTIAGALGGAFAGANVGKGKGQVLGIAAGTLLGGMIGRELGASMDRADMAYYEKTAQNSLEETTTGTRSRWINPDSGNSGSITPTRTYQTNSGQYCREFTQEIIIGGQKEEAYGTACRQADGTWKVVNS